jgi:hypothetical protein
MPSANSLVPFLFPSAGIIRPRELLREGSVGKIGGLFFRKTSEERIKIPAGRSYSKLHFPHNQRVARKFNPWHMACLTEAWHLTAFS